MKNQAVKTRLLKLLSALFVTFALSACGNIPEAYRGKFHDMATGADLTLESNKGTMVLSATRALQADASKLDFDSLVEGKPGIYVRPLEDNKDVIEVFWIYPRKETRHEDSGFVWEDAEVIYARMDTKAKDKVQQLKMMHCEDGQIMLDLPSKWWNGGCPASSTTFDFVRKD